MNIKKKVIMKAHNNDNIIIKKNRYKFRNEE